MRNRIRVALRYALVVTLSALFFAGQANGAANIKVLYTFPITDPDGLSSPTGPLTLDGTGNLYGVSGGGNASCSGGCGTVFQLTRLSNGVWQRNVIYEFLGGDDGFFPDGGLLVDRAGDVYGTTFPPFSSADCGTIFELIPGASGWAKKTLYKFSGKRDGCGPTGRLAFDSSGNLFGSTHGGGCGVEAGTVFELTPDTGGNWSETVLHCFRGGSSPLGGVVLDLVGNIYGAATGGSYNQGIVYRVTHTTSGWVTSKLYDFTGGNNGGNPTAGVTLDDAGNLYGTVPGGADNVGLVYKLSPTNGPWKFSILHTFTGGDDGGNPFQDTLAIGPSGSLYGTTWFGGLHQWGTAFKLVLSNTGHWTETVLHSFTNGSDGIQPSSVVFGPAGNLFGTASLGTNGNGVVYELRE
jgi:hypothetical protein